MTSHANDLFVLAKEGQHLLLENHQIPTNPATQLSQPVFDWLVRCNRLLSSVYGSKSEEVREFSKAFTLKMSVAMLFDLANKQSQKEHLPAAELENPVHLLIEQITPIRKKEEAQKIFSVIKAETASANPDWKKATAYLKQSFDVSLEFACELTFFVYTAYKQFQPSSK